MYIYGFDYSSDAIQTARQLFPEHSEFIESYDWRSRVFKTKENSMLSSLCSASVAEQVSTFHFQCHTTTHKFGHARPTIRFELSKHLSNLLSSNWKCPQSLNNKALGAFRKEQSYIFNISIHKRNHIAFDTFSIAHFL